MFCSEEVPETPSSPVESEGEDEAPGSSDGSREATEKPPPDLASLAVPGFFKNLGAHPNLKGLPGLDFEIPFASPILGMKYSGLIGHMLLPYYDKRANYTHSRLVHVGERIKQVMVIAIRVFEDNPKMNTLRDLYEETFKVLREVDASWDFPSSWQKSRAVLTKIVTARKRYLEKNDGVTKTREDLLPFLKAIDRFLERVDPNVLESRSEASKAQDGAEYRNLKRSSLGDGSDEVSSQKKARVYKADEIPSKLSDDEIEVLNAKTRDLEKRLQESDAKWSSHVSQIWGVARPFINGGIKAQGQGEKEWEEDQLQGFLRGNGLVNIAKELLGVERVAQEDISSSVVVKGIRDLKLS
ncbi:uncharacterized protein CCOS01_09485 [Colletotrichum costaricense]|uniref:Uncharacterized protein n=1 Tax=Colletotrichum costaricense TaxID=1209916 RepID=A0AAJ0DZT3_9PEZI|nr:uncharacterized protein CCOS01_09485 [Colletotrichum costaricense]KAK1524398.1 hypothetical protein CCOS01_09485 [Colletotrichum costaricense]